MTASELPQTWGNIKIGHLCSDVSLTNPKAHSEGEFVYIDISSVDSTRKIITAVQTISNKNAPSRARQKVYKAIPSPKMT